MRLIFYKVPCALSLYTISQLCASKLFFKAGVSNRSHKNPIFLKRNSLWAISHLINLQLLLVWCRFYFQSNILFNFSHPTTSCWLSTRPAMLWEPQRCSEMITGDARPDRSKVTRAAGVTLQATPSPVRLCDTRHRFDSPGGVRCHGLKCFIVIGTLEPFRIWTRCRSAPADQGFCPNWRRFSLKFLKRDENWIKR